MKVNKKIMSEQGYKYPYSKFTAMYFQLLGPDQYNMGCVLSLDVFYRPHGEGIMNRTLLPELWDDDDKASSGAK